MNRTLPISLKVNPNEINNSAVQNINQTIELELSVLKDKKFFNKFITSIHKNNSLVLKHTISGSITPNGELTNIKITVNPNIIKMKFQKSPIIITTAIQNLRSH